MLLPDPIDQHPGRQRIGGVGDGPSQFQPRRAGRKNRSLRAAKCLEKSTWHRRAAPRGIATQEDPRIVRGRPLGKHVCPHRRQFGIDIASFKRLAQTHDVIVNRRLVEIEVDRVVPGHAGRRIGLQQQGQQLPLVRVVDCVLCGNGRSAGGWQLDQGDVVQHAVGQSAFAIGGLVREADRRRGPRGDKIDRRFLKIGRRTPSARQRPLDRGLCPRDADAQRLGLGFAAAAENRKSERQPIARARPNGHGLRNRGGVGRRRPAGMAFEGQLGGNWQKLQVDCGGGNPVADFHFWVGTWDYLASLDAVNELRWGSIHHRGHRGAQSESLGPVYAIDELADADLKIAPSRLRTVVRDNSCYFPPC